MSGIRLHNKAITAVDTLERIKFSLASKEKTITTTFWGPEWWRKHFGLESLLNLHAVSSFSLHGWTGASIRCYFSKKNENKCSNTSIWV